jgi:hypothetical protein
MSTNDMPTLYKIVEDICMRDFDVVARLSKEQQKELFQIIHQDILEGDNPTDISENDIYFLIEEFIAKALSSCIKDVVDFNAIY